MIPMRLHTLLFLASLFLALFASGVSLMDKPLFADAFFLLAAAVFGSVALTGILVARLIPARCNHAGCGGPAKMELKRSGGLDYRCGRCGRVEESGITFKYERNHWLR